MSYIEGLNDYPSRDVYRGFSREDILDYYEVDVEGGLVISRSSGEVLLSKTPKDHLVVYCRREGMNTHLQQRYMIYMVGRGHVPLHPYVLGYKDSNPENISLSNLVVIPPGRGVILEESIRNEYEEVSDRIFYSEKDDTYVVRRGRDQSVYRTPYLDEAEFIRNEWKTDKSVLRVDRYQWVAYKNLGFNRVNSPKLDKTCVWHLYNRSTEKSHV